VKYVALLRAVNVGSRNRVSMPKLKALLESHGYEDVVTYLQSGNVVLRSGDGAAATAAALERAIADLGVTSKVLLRTPADLRKIASANPFACPVDDARKLLVVFLSRRPAGVSKLDPDRSPPDEFSVRGREIYLHLPNGFARSKLTVPYFERALGVEATARNWKTVLSLVELTRR
jgi:uncharacterized protein (DUF1697 family)